MTAKHRITARGDDGVLDMVISRDPRQPRQVIIRNGYASYSATAQRPWTKKSKNRAAAKSAKNSRKANRG